MALARAFTTKNRTKESKKSDISTPLPYRSLTTKRSMAQGDIRAMISGPVQLISTTNMLSYNAPDLFQNKGSDASTSDSESGRTAHSRGSTPPTSPDSSSIGESLSSPATPEPNHLSCYFGASSTQRTSSSSDELTKADAPTIPSRAPSHTKKVHELSHKRSVSRVSGHSRTTSLTQSRNNSVTYRTSRDMFSGHNSHSSSIRDVISSPIIETPSQQPNRSRSQSQTQTPPALAHSMSVPHLREAHSDRNQRISPFHDELAKVTELAEEFGAMSASTNIDPEEQELIQKGLFKFSAMDYMDEISSLVRSTFGEVKAPSASRGMATMWI